MSVIPVSIQRVWREVKEVNRHFFNLRTILQPDEQNALMWYFVTLPNDGAHAHLPLIGRLIIPQTYPQDPPVVQLYNKTGRYNVDVFSHRIRSTTHSTLCFDILRPKSAGGKWKPEFTLSSLFASLMASIVSFYVPQGYGQDRAEYVSMEKLVQIKRDNALTYQQHKHHVPPVPTIPIVLAAAVDADRMVFPDSPDLLEVHKRQKEVTSTYGPIFLQDETQAPLSFAVDLSNLQPGVVFSVILTSDPTDLAGKEQDTILCRNGVTATAARKQFRQTTNWYYHGKPMDGSTQLWVTITATQFTMAYEQGDKLIVHGDCPISKLSSLEVGDVKGKPFYVCVYMKRKFGNDSWVTFKDTQGKGYIHDGTVVLNQVCLLPMNSFMQESSE